MGIEVFQFFGELSLPEYLQKLDLVVWMQLPASHAEFLLALGAVVIQGHSRVLVTSFSRSCLLKVNQKVSKQLIGLIKISQLTNMEKQDQNVNFRSLSCIEGRGLMNFQPPL